MKGGNNTEKLSLLALSQLHGVGVALLRKVVDVAGSATNLFANIGDIQDILPGVSPKFVAALSDKNIMERAKREMDFIVSKGIELICLNDENYPFRLRECEDAPIILYTMGNVNLNARHIVSIVGTRRVTQYGKEICERFVTDLAQLLPGTLVVSGLAYGVDVCAHRAALTAGLPTVGVLAHGLDKLYPSVHRNVAKNMLENGGLLTEFMTGTNPLPPYFLQRNRIVAGLADATVVVESASHGGSLVTASLAQGYSRDCFAFPGRVNDQYSCGCNELIAKNRAALITSAHDFVEAMNWQPSKGYKTEVVQPELFPELSAEEQRIIQLLKKNPDGLQVNQMVIELETPINSIMSILLELEMRGIVKAMAGGCYRAIV